MEKRENVDVGSEREGDKPEAKAKKVKAVKK